jgi:hypothetical protein
MRYLGYIYARGGQLSAAIDAYQRSINAFDAISEVLEYTTSVIALEKLTPEVSTEGDLQTRINRISQSVQKRAYVARFPDRLLRLFRRISLLVALPISFFSIFILTAFFVSVLFNLEGGVRLFLIGEPIDLAIFRSTILLTIVMIGFLAIVWLYRLIYTTIGAVVVSLLGRNLIVVEQEEPICYTVDSSRLQIQSGHLASQEQTLTIPWNEIVQVSSLDYYRWGSPIALYSTTQVILKDLSTVDIPALTNHYTDLIHMIKRNVSESAKLSTFSFSVFRSWFSIVTIVTALLISIGRVFTRELFDLPGFCLTRAVAEGRQPVPLWITSVMLFFLVSLLLLFQTGLLWRLLLHQNTIRRQSGYRSKALPASVIFVLAVLSTLLTILWAIFLYRLPYL